MALDPLSLMRNAFILIGDKLGSFLASLLSAFVILIIGYIIGKFIWKGCVILLEKIIDLDSLLQKKKLENALYGVKISRLLSTLLKWYIYLIFLSQAMYTFEYDILKKAGEYLYMYLPAIYVAVGILILGAFFGEILKNFILSMNIKYKEKVGETVKVIVLYFSSYFALSNLGVHAEILLELFKYFLISAAVGAGIALGFLIVYENRRKLKI